MAVSTRMSVDSSGFKQGIEQAKASLKTLDAALKTNEASFKAGGNAEIYMQQKTQLLNDKMTKQRDLVTMLQGKMEKMKAAGVSPLSTEYQRLETQMLNAQTSMLETKTTIDDLDSSQQAATNSAEKLSDGVNGIGRKLSLDQVISGISRITSAMEAAAQKAAELGRAVWSQITDTAAQADDLATMAVTYGVDPELLQRQLKIFDTMADTSIEAFYTAKDKINKALRNPSKEQANYLKLLGLDTSTYDTVGLMTKDAETALWAVGKRLREKVEAGDGFTQDDADLYAKALFGKSYKELNPLFAMGQKAFNEAVGGQTAATAEALEAGDALNDSIILMEKNFETLKLQILGEIAPSLQTVTDSISGLINKLVEYAQSEEGQALLQSMADSISSMLSGLTEIDPSEVIEKFTSIFDTIKDGFNWITENKDTIYDAIKYIAGGFALLKVSETVLNFFKLGQGIKGLFGGLGGSGGGTEATAAAATGSGVVQRLMATGATKAANLTNVIGGPLNGAALVDWFMNQTYTGQVTRNTGNLWEGITQGFGHAKQEFDQNLQSFSSDWKRTFENMFSNPKMSASNFKLFDPQQLQSEIDALFGAVEPVPVQTEPQVDPNAASNISKSIGTVQVNGQLNISNYPSWISWTGGAGGGNKWTSQHLHAAGMPYVPYDGYLAMLHRGERVLTAGDNRDYSPALNRRISMEDHTGNSGRMIDVTLMIGPERLTEVLVPLVDNGLGEIVSLNRR